MKVRCDWIAGVRHASHHAFDAAKFQHALQPESIAAGWNDFEHMQQDPDLTVLRSLREYEELLHITPLPAMPE